MPVTRSRRTVGTPGVAPVEGLEQRTLFAIVTVNSTADTTNTTGPTVTLRDAVVIADAATSATTIQFDSGVFGTDKRITLTGTALELSNAQAPITIQGPTTANLSLDGGALVGIFLIDAGVHANISNLTLTNADGHAISNAGTLALTDSTVSNSLAIDTTNFSGAGLYNTGTANVNGVTFSGNTALFGGGLYSRGTASVVDSTFSNNAAVGGSGVVGAVGGGAFVDGATTFTNDTFNTNTGTDGGAALYVSQTGSASVYDNTIAQNGNSTGIDNAGAARNFTIANTIVTGGNIDAVGSFTSLGFNLIGSVGGSTGWLTTDQTGTAEDAIDPQLDALADNGGPTLTMLPIEGSPALNKGSSTVVPTGVTTDQRGLARVIDGTVDVGAVEVAKLITVTPPAAQTAVPGVAESVTLGSFATTGVNGPYTVTIAWGDGTANSTESAAASGTIGALQHVFPAVGTDTVTITVVDATGLFTGSGTFTVVVANLPSITVTPAAAQTAVIDTSKTIALGSFTQATTTGPYTVTVDWGDHSTPDTTFTLNAAGTITATAHAFITSGTDTVTVTVATADGTTTGSATFPVTVTTGTTASSVVLAESLTTVVSPNPVTLTATVGPATATGVVTFFSNGDVIDQSAVVNGVASISPGSLAVGTDALTAVYSGDTTYASSNTNATPLNIVVLPIALPTTSTLSSSAATISTSQSVTLTASIASSSTVTTGQVLFYSNNVLLGSSTVSGGAATFTTTAPLTLGTDQITATYVANDTFATSDAAPIYVAVVQSPTATTLALSGDSKTLAQPVTLTAQIAPAMITATTFGTIQPTGTVSFSYAGNVVGTVAVGPNGVATLTTAGAFPLGISQVSATYAGDANFGASTSAQRSLSVTEHALVPTILSIDTPASAIGGAKVRGLVRVKLANGLSSNQTGDEVGKYTVTLYASTTTTGDPADRIVASVVKSNTVRQGKSTNVTLPVTSFPASLADGTYHLLLVTTDSRGNQELIDTGKTVAVTAPVVALSAAFATLSKNAPKAGAAVALTLNGNVDFTTTLTASIGIATDSLGSNVIRTGLGTVSPVKVTLHPGRATKLKVTGWQSLYAGLPIGTYYFTITLTDGVGHTASAISTAIAKLTTA